MLERDEGRKNVKKAAQSLLCPIVVPLVIGDTVEREVSQWPPVQGGCRAAPSQLLARPDSLVQRSLMLWSSPGKPDGTQLEYVRLLNFQMHQKIDSL